MIDKLLKHLETNRLLIVVGSSGSGKSSVVLGGLLPRLLAGALPGSQKWFYYAPLVPGSDPLAALARRLKPPDAIATEWIPKQVSAFQQNPNHLKQLVEQADHQHTVLVIDQFEEVFTLCQEDKVRQALIRNLLNFVQAPDARNTLILTMRSDFESQVARIPTLKESFESASIRMTALDAGELRETIEKPSELVGLKFEDGLVDALLNDVLGEPAALPLLQFTLLKLWDNREHNRITWKAYSELGGGRQALSNCADQFYDHLIYEEQKTAKRILLRMVRPTEGLEVTSNRIARKDLYLESEARDRVDRVLDRLIQARLVRQTEGDTPEDTQIEVAHEAIIRNWSRLVGWLDDERVRLRQRLHLRAVAEQWQSRERDRNLLLRGAILEEAQRYDDLNRLEINFVRRSQQAEQRRKIRQSFTQILIVTLAVTALGSSIAWLALANQDTRKELKKTQNQLEKTQKEKDIALQDKDAFSRHKDIYLSLGIDSERARRKAEKDKKEANEESQYREQQYRKILSELQSKLNRTQQELAKGDTKRISDSLIALSSQIQNTLQATSGLDDTTANASEIKGFQALLEEDLANARNHFETARNAFPTYHSVDEISNKVLTQDLVDRYNNASAAEKQVIRKKVFKDIVEKYNWGAPPDLLQQMKDRLKS
ncbi:MAG: hypothetical protein KME45_19680 [Stenomitos rutilans HA7619-LM2]|nr:hypothetical protein [Stenomitos rutilans HA7619-LM2]